MMLSPGRMMFWRTIARVLDLGLLTTRPTWREVRYKINGRLQQARHSAEFKCQQKTIEYQQYQAWRMRWLAGHAEGNRKRDRKNAIRIRLGALLSRP